VSAKDIILEVLRQFGTKATSTWCSSTPEAACGAERAGAVHHHEHGRRVRVTTSIFPSDATTKAFLEAQGRGKDWAR